MRLSALSVQQSAIGLKPRARLEMQTKADFQKLIADR